ncbi:ADP-ribosylation factor-like protein 6-interacting protein 4 [Labeo rohita]|uniref:ADP-ribosylation factor-like protein 6-interacting protein 4 n=1 Tax=Labeo rohita TaxID=84645 RepID=UPI0021E31CA3|nr:ADP-ribosylation factor-like protein 6-interacting protein 4 [Labeo rohita]XP_050964687.1 ADP-ribosylation factor-like protein 6-interacting protein 4 [Labeo rohita]XP_050964688.1 ADP-ribosylation factor-like protein 6-interacting protein 4 [Labeo rohita]
MGGSDDGSRSKSRHRDESKSRSLSSSSARRSSPSPQKKRERSTERKKMKRRSPSSSSSSSSSTSPSREKKAKKKKKRREVKKLKREKKKEKKEKKRLKKLALKAERAAASQSTAASDEKPETYLKTWQIEEAKEHGPVMTDEQKARLCTKRPMTKEEYEARQSVIRRVLDPETGRTRLVRGDGEILEEIVSKDRHKEINKQATKGDGDVFQKRLGISR